ESHARGHAAARRLRGREGSLGQSEAALDEVAEGHQFFDNAFPKTNGRACATCHVEADHFALTPAHVQALFAQNPSDPLFNRIDDDDPNAAVPTYDHLKAGLVRVTIRIGDNLDVIEAAGNVVTNAARTIDVWTCWTDVSLARNQPDQAPFAAFAAEMRHRELGMSGLELLGCLALRACRLAARH